ncbi:MAG: ATP-binding protein, partial [Candidatus Paceibacterota bacterium]
RVNEYQVLLVDELEFTNAYLEIEKTRFSDRLIVESHVDPDTLEVMVPSFLLQPLVENAIRHGIAKKATAGTIKITSSMEGERLMLSVEDSGPGLTEGEVSTGIGLSNIEERLNHLYDKYTFSLQSSELGGLKVLIEFPVNNHL